MAYANLVNQAVTDWSEIFQRLRDFVCKRSGTYDYSSDGIGWTLHDSSYAVDEDNLTANDWVVLYSAGEGGLDDLYVKITYKGTTSSIYMVAYLYWDNSTHAGVQLYGYDYDVMYGSGAADLSIYGDLDHVSVIPEFSGESLHYGAHWGRTIDGPYNQDIVTTTSAVSAGSDVAIPLSSVPSYGFEQFQNIYIRDDAGVEIIQIKSIAGSNITVDLVNSYASGAKVQADICYMVQNSQNYGRLTSTSHAALIGRTGATGNSATLSFRSVSTSANFEDSLQSNIAPGVTTAGVGNSAGFYGWGGIVPNILLANVITDCVHNQLYYLHGAAYRFKNLRYDVGIFFLEV